MSDTWASAVDLGDVDETIRWVDRISEAHDWDELDRLRERCARAHERGHQLWPAAGYAAHRLALDGPAELAARVAQEPPPAFGLGPLWEVAASTHGWTELAPFLEAGPVAALIAQERVLRGEDLTDSAIRSQLDVEVPLVLAELESAYTVARYRADSVVVDDPPDAPLGPPQRLETSVPLVADPAVDAAWASLVDPWLRQSEGALASVAATGTAEDAIASMCPDDAVRLAPIPVSDALAHMQWAAASGGSHGRRRGGAVGRTLAWWTVATILDVVDDWPLSVDELTAWSLELDWYAWEPAGATGGWTIRLAVVDHDRGVSRAMEAVDDGDAG